MLGAMQSFLCVWGFTCRGVHTMKVLMTGATGLVGTALTRALVRDGHSVCRMVRRETVSRKADSPSDAAGPRVIDVPWDPEASGGLTFARSEERRVGKECRS